MDLAEAKEKYYKAVEVIKDLKKQNNSLKDAQKKLKTKMRWPEHLRAAVQNKELVESHNLLEARLFELSKQCTIYEREISCLKQQRAQATSPKHSERNFKTQSENSSQSHFEHRMQEMQEQETCLKQQLEEAGERLQQSEDRLAQVLRLRTMDSAELFRLSRANKVMTAEVTTLQDDNHRLKLATDEIHNKMDELVAQLTQEQQRRTELQEEVAQAQLMQQSMHDLTQELEEVKQERDMLRGHLKASLAEATRNAESMVMRSEQEMSLKMSELQRTLDEKTAGLQQLSLQLDKQKHAEHERAEQQQRLERKLKELLEKLATRRSQTNTKEQGVQTVNVDMDFKPPELSCGLSPEEGDLVLAQMHHEIESHRELLRTQTHLAKMFKAEMESLREELQEERARYASELSEKMARIQEMQNLLSQQCSTEPKSPPIPAPRQAVVPERRTSPRTLQALEIDIQGLSATEGSVLLHEDGCLFVEYTLSPMLDEPSHETQGNFPRPSVVGQPVAINHVHCWYADETVELCKASRLHFNVVGEPLGDADEDCMDFGTAEVPLEGLWDSLLSQGPDTLINLEVPIVNEENVILGHLHVTIRHPNP